MTNYHVISGDTYTVSADSEAQALEKFYHVLDYTTSVNAEPGWASDVEEIEADTIVLGPTEPGFNLVEFLTTRLTELREKLLTLDENDSLSDYVEGCIDSYEIILAISKNI
jgi:hypothetical protein